jgi:hypothetical protein
VVKSWLWVAFWAAVGAGYLFLVVLLITLFWAWVLT